MITKKTLSTVTALLMAAACMLPYPAIAAENETDVTAASDISADIFKTNPSNTTIDNYEFYCPDIFLNYGSNMTASTNGRFSGEYKTPPFQLKNVYAEFSSMYKFDEMDLPSIDENQDIHIDYSLNDRLKGKYGIFYDFMLERQETDQYRYTYFDVAEKLSDMEIDDFFRSFNTNVGNSQLFLKSYELIKTYTLSDHEYDLYKVEYHYSGCFNVYDEIRYLAVRKDSADNETIENSIDIYDHMSKLSELTEDDIKISAISLIFRIIETDGDFEVTKQDISVIEQSTVPEVISGDFNSDKRIDSMDVVHARKALLKHMSSEGADTPEYADINLNGKFDVADIVMLQSFVIGRIKAFPASE